ncbi:hypothetical protein ACIOUG_01250 [Pseudomonas sp. NPDC087803]|uniref:hypothetical protein n=1 Tax=Pseudomonas sp. NPDC087803 TaxID=3364448 RepID=UPI0037F1AA62
MYYSAVTNSWYDDPANYSDFPSDAVELTAAQYDEFVRFRPADKRVVPGPDGLPMIVDIPVPSLREQTEAKRLQAYADPITGSDRFFSEAARLQMMGADESEIQVARQTGLDRYAEIQADFPWPE